VCRERRASRCVASDGPVGVSRATGQSVCRERRASRCVTSDGSVGVTGYEGEPGREADHHDCPTALGGRTS
jgi:hypothetical protein